MSFRQSVILISCLLIFSCGQNRHEDKQIFRYNESSGITSLDPIKATNLPNIWAVQQIYEGLTRIDSNGIVKPLLAINWEIRDSGRVYLFEIKKGVQFHKHEIFPESGRELNANDVTYSLTRLYKSSSGWIISDIKSDEDGEPLIESINNNLVKIELESSSNTLPQRLAAPSCGIVPREIVEQYGNDFRRTPVGTGPFYLIAWHENEKMVLRKNAGYHIANLPKIDGISISFLKDKQTAMLEFIRGNFDLLSGIDAAYKDELLMGDGTLNPKYESTVKLTKQPYLNTEYLGIFLGDDEGPLSNIHLRRALNFGLDRGKLIKYIRNGVGIAGHNGLVPPILYGENLSVTGYEFNQGEFRNEISLAGYNEPNEVPLIKLYTDVAYTDICTFIANQWNELGLNISIEVLDRPTLKSEVAKGNLGFFRASWIADYPDPENYLNLFNSHNKSPNGPNYTHFDNVTIDQLLDEAKGTPDSTRLQKFRTIDSLVLIQSPVIILYYDQVVRFTNKRVNGMTPHPMNYLDLRTVELN